MFEGKNITIVVIFFSIKSLFNKSPKAKHTYKAQQAKGQLRKILKPQAQDITLGPREKEMSAAFHREPQHHLRLDYHRRTTHRFTEPHHPPIYRATPELINSTPSSPRPRTSQVRLIWERINRKRDLIRHSSTQTPRRRLRSIITLSTGELPSSSDEISSNKPEPNSLK